MNIALYFETSCFGVSGI